MSVPTAILLGFVQGLTEFLPISSSGHLVLLQNTLGFAEPPVFFDVLVHVGTLLAVLVFFRKELKEVIGEKVVVRGVLVGTVPIVVVGLAVQPFIEEIFGSLLLTGLAYFFTAGLLWWSRRFESTGTVLVNHVKISARSALVIGLFQAVAVLPGVSRSGSTIVGGLSQGFSREAAFKFSFYLAVPAILGALVLQIKDLTTIALSAADLLGMLTAFVVGYAALLVLKKVLLSGKLYLFSFYCAFLGLLALALLRV